MLKNILLHSSFFLLCLLFLILIISNIAFLFNFDINIFNIVISILISLGALVYTLKNKRDCILSVTVAMIISLISYNLANTFFDLSYDGQGYHQETIYLLKNGWNPIYEESHAFRSWINYYQKGNEIIQSNIYYLTDKIESGKMINMLFIYIAFATSFVFLSSFRIKHLYKWLFSFIVVFNPVVFTQVFTNYIDANWYLTLVICLASLGIYFMDKKPMALIFFIFCSVIFCSLKLTSIPVFIVLVIFAFSYQLLFHKKKMIMPFLTIFLLSVICNAHPFSTNLQKGYHILHPFAGAKKSDILNQNIPEVLLNRNRVERIMISLFSESGNNRDVTLSKTLKIPFTVSNSQYYLNYDTRLGGFGFLFSGILIITLLIAIYTLWNRNKHLDKKKLGFILAFMLCTILINPASWWARLSPQIWLLPIIVILSGLLSKNKACKMFSHMSLVLFLINISLPAYLTYINLRHDNKTMNQFIEGVAKKTIILDISNPRGFRQYYLKFKERNINYKLEVITNKNKLAPFTPDVYYQTN